MDWTSKVYDWLTDNMPEDYKVFFKDSVETYTKLITVYEQDGKKGILPVSNLVNASEILGVTFVEILKDYLMQEKKVRLDSFEVRDALSYYSYENFTCGDNTAVLALDEEYGVLVYFKDSSSLRDKYTQWKQSKEQDTTQPSTNC